MLWHLGKTGLTSRTSYSRYTSTKTSTEPLRILFCGSDEFSIASLRALHEEHERKNGSIASIDVVCRPAKRVGRGLEDLRTRKSALSALMTTRSEFDTVSAAPIGEVTRGLSLPLHELDTFTGWAVSN